MPAEVRHLIFSNSELATAIATYFQKTTGTFVPDILRVEVDSTTDSPSVAISSKVLKKLPRSLAGEELLACLIFHCTTQGIPLPSRGAKELCTMHGRLTLVVKLPAQASQPAKVS